MVNERLLKKGQIVESEEEMADIQAKARGYIQVLRGVFDNAVNLPQMDTEMALVIVKDMQLLKERYRQLCDSTQVLKKELGA